MKTSVSASKKHKSTAYSQRLALESRLVFDGAMAATVADVQPDNIDKPIIDNTSASAAPAIEPPVDFLPEKAAPVVDFQPSTDSTTDSPAFFIEPNPLESMNLAMTPVMDVKGDTASTVIVIDPRADNAAALLANPPANTQILTLDPTRDGFQQVADYLQTRHDVTNLHLLTWTDSNTQWLGNKALTGTIESSVSNELALWGDGIAPKANIVFHGADKLSTGWLDYIDALTGATTRWSQDTDVTNALPPRTEIVFIESNITDYQMLMTDVNQGAEVHLLNASQDSLTQIAQILNGRTNIDAIHLFSHGSSASLSLGSDALNSGNLGSYTDVLKQIGSSLSATGDILLYGCDVAQGNAGLQFISQLGILTGADIAASTDLTGAATQGGDWVLEANIGAIEASTLQAVDYAGVLVNLTPTAGGTDNLTGTAVPDNLIISSATIAGYVASGDVFNGGGGNDAIQLSATTALTVDFTGVTLQNWTMLTFSNTGGSTDTVTFTGSQFGTGLVSNALAVNGTGGIQAIVINNSANFTAAGWTFPTWTSGTDTITINGTTSNDTITGSSQKDTITGGTGADILTGGAGADNFTFAAGNSVLTIGGSGTAGTLSGYDVITDYASGSDTLNFTAASLVANGTNINGADSTLQLHTGVVVGTHTIANGIITFNTATPLTSSADVAAAVQYLQAQNWTANGSTVAFNATFGGINHTFVFVQGSANGATDSQDVVIDLQNRTVTAIAGTNILTLTTGIGTVLAPAAPILSPASDSGTLLDNITNDNTPTITGAIGSAAAGAIITFTDSVAGSSLTGATTTVLADGSWSYTPTTALTDTVHSLTVQQTVGGTLSTASTALSLTIDTAAPITSTNTGLTTVLEDAAITTITSAMLSVTDAEPAALLTYTIGTVPTKGVLSKSGVALGVGGTFTQADINSGLLKYTPNFNANGSDSVGFSVSDGAGGTLSGQTFNFTITPVADVNITAGITPVEGATGTFTITLDSAPAADLTVNYTLDSASTATLTTDYTVSAGAGISAVTAGTFTILAGQTTATLNVNALTDVVVDPNETVILKLAAGSGYQLAATPSSSFAAKVDYATGTTPYSVSAGDFNGDGKADLVVANSAANTVSVLLNNGDGTFAAKVDYATGTTPYSVSVGDVDGDGKADLVVANYGANTVSVLSGTGTGTFAAKVDYTTGTNPSSVSLGDFNGDGKLDLAVANRGASTVSVLLRNAANTGFDVKLDYATGSTPYSVTTGDFNGDGKLDMAVANYVSITVSVFLRNSANTDFDPKVDYSAGGATGINTGDFNGDGKLDIVTTSLVSNRASVLLRNSTNTGFDTAVNYPSGTGPRSVSVGDFNNDGKLDLALADSGSNNVSVLLGTGTGTFAAKVDYATGTTPYSVTTGDFNGDGRLDLAVANSASNNVSVLLNNAAPSATLTITDVPNTAPTLGGTFTTAGAVNDNTTTTPFSNVTVNDTENNNVSITITYTAANGTLTGAGLTGTAGNYTLTSASLATVQSNLRALVFTPTANQVIPASTVQTIFTLTPNDGTVNGTANATTKVTATSINDAPTGLGNLTLAAVNEDTVSPAGAAINTLGVVFADADVSSSLSSVAIVANTANAGTQGAWQYSTNGGTNWFDIGTVADNNTALALSATTLVRFVPVANYNGAPTGLTVRALDNTYNSFSTTAGLEVRVSINTTTRGGSTAISNSSNTLNTSITAVNDAPTASFSHLAYETVTPQRDAGGNIVYSVNNAAALASTVINRVHYYMQTSVAGTLYYADVSFDAWAGLTIADLQVPAQGAPFTIQRNVTNMTVSSNYAGVVNGSGFTGRLEIWPNNYLPATTGNIGGSSVIYDFNDTPDIATVMGYGSFQVHNFSLATPQTVFAWNRQQSVGFAPDIGFGNQLVANPDWTFAGQNGTSLGTTNWKLQISVDNNVGNNYAATEQIALTIKNTGLSIADVDAGNNNVTATLSVGEGALTVTAGGSGATVSGSGTSTVTITGTVSQINQLLNLDATSTVSYIDNTNTPSASTVLTLSVNDGGNTGSGGVLTGSGTATINITAVNDAPVLDNTQSPTLTAINEDVLDASNTGNTVASLVVNGSITDVDVMTAPEAIAISAVDNTNGVWQYQVGAGAWTAIDFVANSGKALLLDSADSIRFVPNANWNGTVSNGITFYAWDKTSGSAGAYLTVSGNTGGTATLSTATDTASLVVNAVNDAPTFIGGANTGLTVLEDAAITTITAAMLQVTDVEQAANALTYTLTTASTKGVFSKSGAALGVGGTFTQADINSGFIKYTPNLNANGSDSVGFSVSDGAGGTLSAQTFNFTITPVADVNITAGITPVEGAAGTFTITLDSAPTADLVINYTLDSASTATLTTDYTVTAGAGISAVTAGTFTIFAGQTTATLNVNALTDAVVDPNETVILKLATGAGYQLPTGTLSFATKADYGTGTTPYSVTTGDFNGDGKLDMAVINQGANTVSVLLRNAANTGFDAKVDFATGASPSSVATGDFNGDGKLDMAVINQGANTVSVLLRNAANTGFDAKVDFATGASPVFVTTGDFNGDGKLDMVLANNASGTVSVLLRNTANTGFDAKIDTSTGVWPFSIATGDFNGDGKLDMAVANYNSDTVSVLLRNAANTGFDPKVDIAMGAGSRPRSVTTGDFNGDGKLDIAVANFNANTVSVLLRNATNTGFDAKIDSVTGTTPYSVTTGDFNGDGKLDIAVANFNANTVSVLLRNAANTGFDAKVDVATGAVPISVTTGDFNGDGKLDMAVANQGADTVSVLLNNSAPSATLTITDVNTAPTLGGTFTTAGAVNDNTTTTPFSNVTVNDAESNNVSITITYTAANGTLAGAGLTGTAGNYTLTSASLATVQSNLRALVFTPTANQVVVGSTVQTTFTLTPNDGTVNGTANATTNITATSINDAPTATNLNTPETYTEDTALNLTDIVISDVDIVSSNVYTATLTLSNTAAGSLSTATSGATTSTYNAGTGVWSASGSKADVNVLLAGVTFNPALNFNSSFNIATSISDGIAAAVIGTKAFTGIAVNDAPILTGTVFVENFDTLGLTGNSNAQYLTGLTTHYNSSLAGWQAAGNSTFHGVEVQTGNWAFMIYADNVGTQIATIAANTSGTTYTVNFDVAPSVHFISGQASDANDKVDIKVYDASNNLLADYQAGGGVMSATPLFIHKSFTYTGNGNGNIHFVIGSAFSGNNHFAGTIDNLSISSQSLTAINEDVLDASNTGNTVASIVVNGSITDVDYSPITSVPESIAVSTVDNTNGVWQYKIGAGAWIAFDFITNSGKALLLDSADSIRFVPNANWNGTVSGGITFYAWDKTSGTAGSYLTVSGNTGGSGTLSTASDTASILVNAVNDAPTGLGNLTLAAVNENTASPAGAAINTLTGFSFTDIDTGATLKGVAVVGSGDGNWQYSTNGGTNWYSIGAVGIANTLVLTPTTLVRYLPLPNFIGTPFSLQVNALDNTYAGGFSSTVGAETRVMLNASVNGGATAIANNSNTISTSVTDVNPVIFNATATLNENSVAGTVVTTVTATNDTNGLIYSITGGNSDVDGDGNLAFSINPSTGVITVNDAGDLNFESIPSFSLAVAVDDEDPDTIADSTATITVNLQNLDEVAPTITSSATTTAINENSGVAQVIYTVTSTDTGDIATGATAYSLSGTDATLFSINSITGAVTLTANPNFEAQSNYSFNVVATDAAGNASSKAVTLAINDLNEAPSVTSSGTLSVAENSTGTVYTATGTDPDTAQTLSWSISGIDAALFSINSSSGALTFNTLPNFELPADNGADNVYDLTVIATDNGTGNLTASKALTITVTNVNEAPTTSAPVSINVTEDVATALTGISFADVDAGSSSVTATLAVNSGTLSATSGSGVTVTGSGTASMTLAGTLANINAFIANSAVSFTTASNSISDVILSSSLNDNGNSGSGGALSSAVSTTTLMVTSIADTPSVASLTINEDIDSGAIVITRNAVDGAEVTHYKITSITGGTLYSDAGFTSVISAGSFIVSSGATTNVYFRPIADSNTAGAFTVQASTSNTDAGLGGATATSTINITPIADTASVTSTSTIPAIQTTSGLVISRNAVDGAEVTYFKITNIANGTLYQNDGVTQITANSFITFAQANAGLKFTPSGVSNGSFDVQASTSNVDAGLGGSISTATISLGIAIANANTNEDTSTGAIAISGNTGFYKITGITGGTLYSDAGFTTAIINGSFIATSGATTNVYFRPTADFNGTASFVAQGSSSNSDAGLTGNTATSTITVNPVNDAPTGLGNLTLLAVDEDTVSPAGAAINSLGVVFTDVDAGASLAGVAVIANTANANTQGVWQYSTNGINWYNIGTVTGNSALALTVTTSVRFVPALNFNGTPPSLTVRALDNTYAEGFTNGAVLVTTNATINGGSRAIAANTNTIGTNNIVAVNDAPVFSGLANTVNFTEDSAAVALGNVITLSDVDLNSLNYANATLTLVRNGSANAEDVFANTGTLGALTQGGNLTVNGVVIGTVTANSAGLLSLTFNSNATKALVNSALQQITYSNSSNTPPTSVQINWLFNDNNTGAQGKGGAFSALRSTTVNITPTNDAPIAMNDSATVVNGGTLNGSSLLANDTDPENDVLTVNTTPITNVAHGTLTLYANGSYLYQHDGSAAKTDSFVYEITDGHGGKAQATVTMTISGSPLVQPSSGNAVFLNNLSVFFDNFLTSGSLILLSNPSHYNESDSRYIFEDKKQLLDYQYHGDYGLPPVHLSLYVPLRYHHIISVAGFLPNQTLIAQEFYAFKIPKWLFQHRNSYETLKFTATHLDGKALPDWIKLNPKTLTFFGLAPKGAHDMSVMMTIGDQYGNKAHSVFTIHVTDKVPAKNVVGEQRRVAGKSGFSEQLYSAGKVSKLQESRRLLDSLNHL